MQTLVPPRPKSPPTIPQPISPVPASGWSRLWAWTQFTVCLALTGSVLAYLLWTPATGGPAAAEDQQSAPKETVRLAGPKCICIEPDCPLCRKLQVTTVQPVPITAPVLTVTGTVVASLRPGKKGTVPLSRNGPEAGTLGVSQKGGLSPFSPADGKGADSWQFNSSELLTAFTDWQKATADIVFAETQLAQIKQLADTRTSAQQKLVERMKKLVEAGTDTQKDLATAEADLIQSQIQGRKEVHEAETAARLARRTEAALARQLQQAGLEPELLQSAASDLDIVMADVPEGMMSRVKIGQGCEARFFGFPFNLFSGKVRAISPVLSKERRSLRVLFAINDPKDQLRPGMFADIGLGTDARNALLVPPEAIVHVGRADYVLVGETSSDWRVTEVQVGELHPSGVEILSGLQAGNRVAGQGAILLKPYIIQALQTHGSGQAARSECGDSSPLSLSARPAGGEDAEKAAMNRRTPKGGRS